jgi:hypothetical protein
MSKVIADISMSLDRPEALTRLDVSVGEWIMEAPFTGAWEKSPGGADWEHDFALTCRRAA